MKTTESNGQVSLLRMRQVLALIPISRSSWLAGVKSGRFPRPVKIGPATNAWKSTDIENLINSFTSECR